MILEAISVFFFLPVGFELIESFLFGFCSGIRGSSGLVEARRGDLIPFCGFAGAI